MTARTATLAAAGLITLATLVQAAEDPSKPAPDDAAQVAALRAERIKLLDTVLKMRTSQYQVGTVDFDKLCSAYRELFAAELEDADGDHKKMLATLTEELRIANDIAAIVKARHQAGTVTEDEVLHANAECLGIKIKLLRERGQMQPPKPAAPR